MDAKQLKRLAKACRQAGIKSYQCGEVSFTLTDEAPVSKYKQTTKLTIPTTDKAFASDALSQEELLYWSSPGTQETEQETNE